jgi:hypothetical protein
MWATLIRHTDKSSHMLSRSKCIEDSMSGSLPHAYQYSMLWPYCRASVAHTGTGLPMVTVCGAIRPSCRTCSPITCVCAKHKRHTADCVVLAEHTGQNTPPHSSTWLCFNTMSAKLWPQCRELVYTMRMAVNWPRCQDTRPYSGLCGEYARHTVEQWTTLVKWKKGNDTMLQWVTIFKSMGKC